MPQIHELVDLIPSPCVVFDLAPFSWPGEGGSLLWGTPPHPPSRAKPLQPFPGFPRSDVLVCGRTSLARYCAHTEQVPLSLNTYLDRGRCHQRTCGGRLFCKFAFFSAVAPPRILREGLFCKNKVVESYRSILRPDLILVPSATTARRSQLGCRHRVRVQQIRPSHRVC